MSKGAYDVNDPNVGPSKDASFRSCICVMLVFISICGIIIVVTTVLKTPNGKTQDYPDNSHGHADSILGNKQPTQSPHRPIDEVETIESQGVDSLTTRSSGQINLVPTTTTIKPVPTKSSIDKTDNALEIQPETTTLSHTATLSTNKPVPESVTSTQTATIGGKDTITESTTQNTQHKLENNQDKSVTSKPIQPVTQETTTDNTGITTQKTQHTPGHDVETEEKDKSVTSKPIQSVTQETTTDNTGITTQKTQHTPGHDVETEEKDKSVTSKPIQSVTQETTTDNTGITTQNNKHTPGPDVETEEKDKSGTSKPIQSVTQETTTDNTGITTQKTQHTPGHDVETEEKDKSVTSKPIQSVTQETTTDNTGITTQNTQQTPGHDVETEEKDKSGTSKPIQSVTQETTTDNTGITTQNTQQTPGHDVETEEKDKSGTSKPIQSVTQETTTDNTGITTQKTQYTPGHDVETEEKDKSGTSKPIQSVTQETTTDNTGITTQKTQYTPGHDVETEEKDKSVTSKPIQSVTQETTADNTGITTQNTQQTPGHDVETEDKDKSGTSKPIQSVTQETTTDNTGITTQNNKHTPGPDVETEEKDKSVTSKPIQSVTQETTTDNTETTTQNNKYTPGPDVETEEKDKSGTSKPIQSVTQETTTDNTGITTQKTQHTPGHDVETEEKDKSVTSKPIQSVTQETTTDNTGITIQNTQPTPGHDVETEEKDKSITSRPIQSVTQETETTTDPNKSIKSRPLQSVNQETTTENLDESNQQSNNDAATENKDNDSSTTQNIELNENKDKLTTNSPQTTQSTNEKTTTESLAITTENIENKPAVVIGNQDKLTTNRPETTTENKDIVTTTNKEEHTTKPTEDENITGKVVQSELPEEKPTENVFSFIQSTTVEPEETTTRPSSYKRLTPAPNERTSTIVETDEIVDHRSAESQENDSQENDPCGEECKTVGARMLTRMNISGDACEHFYDYACGGDFIDNTPEDNWKRIADGLDRTNSQSPDVYKTFKKFYKTCVDFHVDYDYVQRVGEAIHMLETVGNSSIAKIGDKAALTDLLTKLLQLDSSPLFDISVDVDKDSQNFIFQLNLGKQFSTFPDKYTSLTTRRKCLGKSKKYVEFSISHFNAINLNDMYKEYLDCQKTEIYKHETVETAVDTLIMQHEYEDALDYIPKILDQIKDLPSPAVVRNNIFTRQFEIRKVSEMDLHYPSIEWKQLLSKLVGKDVQDEDKVQVYFKDFILKLFGPKPVLNTEQLHIAIIGMYAHDLYTNYILPTPMNNPEEYCLEYSSDLMKEVASSMFLESIDPKNTNDPKQIEIKGDLQRIENLFSKMKRKMSDMIYSASWIDHSVQNSMARKLDQMEFDSWNRSTIWRNMTLVQDRMKSIETDYGNYSGFTTALVKRNRKLLYNMWNTKASNEENVWWHFITPYSTSPKSTYPINSVFIPPGALLTKSEKMPNYLSLVKLGFKLAKAIAHRFDYFGTSGLTGKPKQAYKDAKECILQSYLKINGTEYGGKNLNVKVVQDSFMLSLNDRYAEDLAINLLSTMSPDDTKDYEITWFKEKPAFNREKLFFIALGQEHCKKPQWEDFFVDFFESEHFSTPLLLDNSLSHLELFSGVFECNGGSLMNPPVRCKPFPVNEEPELDDDYE